MIEQQQLDTFVDIVVNCMDNMQKEYISTTFDIAMFQQFERNMPYGYTRRGGVAYKPGERMFAYELYYLLRNAVEEYRKGIEPQFLDGLVLQGEVNKRQLMHILDVLNFQRLSAHYIPDLIVHGPATDENAVIIEIKNSFHLSEIEVRRDLTKIAEFMTRYRYQKGVFVVLSKSMNEVKAFINQNSAYYTQLFNQEISNVDILVKQYADDKTQRATLQNILNV